VNDSEEDRYASHKRHVSIFSVFPAIMILKSAVIRMVIGINNSTKTAFTATTLKTESNKESVCPSVKMKLKLGFFPIF